MFGVKNIMQTEVITVKRDTPIYEAMEKMAKHDITGLPVVDDDMNLVGVITEKDVMTMLYNPRPEAKAEDCMTKDVVSFDHEDSMIDVADSFVKNHFRRVPILADGKVVGIVSRTDIIGYIVEIQRVGGLELAMQDLRRRRK